MIEFSAYALAGNKKHRAGRKAQTQRRANRRSASGETKARFRPTPRRRAGFYLDIVYLTRFQFYFGMTVDAHDLDQFERRRVKLKEKTSRREPQTAGASKGRSDFESDSQGRKCRRRAGAPH